MAGVVGLAAPDPVPNRSRWKQEKDGAAAQPYCGNFECAWMQYG